MAIPCVMVREILASGTLSRTLHAVKLFCSLYQCAVFNGYLLKISTDSGACYVALWVSLFGLHWGTFGNNQTTIWAIPLECLGKETNINVAFITAI